MTESDAKEKWCPQVRFHSEGDGYVYNNRGEHANSKSAFCIASDCMMWKWHVIEIEDYNGIYQPYEISGESGQCGLSK